MQSKFKICNRNSNTLIQENVFYNIDWKMATIFSRPQCVNSRNRVIQVYHKPGETHLTTSSPINMNLLLALFNPSRTILFIVEMYLQFVIFLHTHTRQLAEILSYERQNVMMTSSNGNIFRVTGPLCGEFTGPGEFPAQRPVTRGFDVCFDLRLNKRLSKQPWGWWFEAPSWLLWRQCNGIYTT